MNGLGGGKKTAVVILNGISLKKKIFYHDYLPALSQFFDVEVHETLSRNDARTLAARFTERYPDIIIAAGGDGTVNKVLNGMLQGREKETKLPWLGVIPIGSGNDFARGAGLKTHVDDVMERIAAGKPQAIDIGVVEYCLEPGNRRERATSYFLNVADLGMGPDVVRRVLNSGRPFGSEVAYLKSIVTTFFTYKPMVVKAVSADWNWEGKLRTLAVANGKYYGGGLCIAPDAVMNDRKFSVFICGNVSVLDFILNARKLRKGQKLIVDGVQYRTTTSLEVDSDRPCPIEGDGEVLGWLPAKISMIEKQLNLLV